MKNNIAIGLLVLLLISLYFNFKSNTSLSSLKKEENISFEQKQKCATYKKDIETKFEKENSESLSFKTFDRIFYSSKQNSCLYVYSLSFSSGKSSMQEMYLSDALSGEELLNRITRIAGEVNTQNSQTFIDLVKEYEFGVSATSK